MKHLVRRWEVKGVATSLQDFKAAVLPLKIRQNTPLGIYFCFLGRDNSPFRRPYSQLERETSTSCFLHGSWHLCMRPHHCPLLLYLATFWWKTDTESDAKARYTTTHYPCPRAVNTGVQNDARVHGPRPCLRAVDMGVILEVAVDTARKHGPWTRVVCIPSLTCFL